MSTQQPRLWRVTAIEWLSHDAFIEAETAEHAEAKARDLWAGNAEHEVFHFSNSGLDGFVVEGGLNSLPCRAH